MKGTPVHLGFTVPGGGRVEIPLAHTFVTGQTQLSGKTTTLRAIVERSGRRALAFVTKRGEDFAGRRIAPFLPREGERPIHWRLVETILASALGQRNMKYERLWIVNAAKGARSLADVRSNVSRLQAKAKGTSGDAYMLIGEYLDLVLPEMHALAASDVLDLQPGLNVMDLTGSGPQLQALVIRAALERINHQEEGILTVFPEAWEFAPRGRAAPAKDEAIAMARKGAVLGNFLLCDSQDIAGVDTVVRQAASIWILGVQRELNELRRTLQTIPAGISRPKPEAIAELEVGQFYACWGRNAIKTYVQPAWMDSETARCIAVGAARPPARQPAAQPKEENVTERGAAELRQENERLKDQVRTLTARLDALEGTSATPATAPRHSASARTAATAPTSRPFSAEETLDNERLFQAIKARLIEELPSDPAVLRIVMARPELRVEVERHLITVDGQSLRGRIGRLIAEGFWDGKARTSSEVQSELSKRGRSPSNIELGNEMKALIEMGFFTKDNKWISLVPGMRVNVVEAAA